MMIGKKLQLRAIEAEDLPLLARWRNDPEVYGRFFEHEPLSLCMQRRWFESFLSRNDEKLWVIQDLATEEAIGTIGLTHIDMRNRKAEIGRILVYPENRRGKGFGSEAECLVLRYAFDHLNLNRICCEVFADNEPGIRIHRAFGFQQEALYRQYVYRDGRYVDVVCLAMLKEDYETVGRTKIAQLLS